ncbi:hypothetical protein M4L90_12345 [Staphylococcus equorum]|uniref:Uncharacterized protein n=1 Tax=Staphylococcus equorum TaxID=246432 RepID=A0A9X4L591_9STAP|nr:hypothetical protein [Staphylococcus equorum]MDG0820710.1 hypothetical protein [Staphylococcus equorum]MDG0841335.1 hypothetical protein [Staphylococcus equorum]MDG0847035.1 hypothetical protein [Staphylococcus equorum]PTE82311.1 hypothetical protein BUY85_00810 [Staphylococcus equorum]
MNESKKLKIIDLISFIAIFSGLIVSGFIGSIICVLGFVTLAIVNHKLGNNAKSLIAIITVCIFLIIGILYITGVF